MLEEAHRLLSRTGPPDAAGGGDAKAKAVGAFTDMLAEIRAYGQAVIIADQVPVRLAPEVIKNTDLKIMQRTVAASDRTELAAASAMTDDQSQVLATLDRGDAAVFSEGDDSPLLVRIGPVPPTPGKPRRLDDHQAFALSRHDPGQDPPAAAGQSAAGRALGQGARWRAAVSRFAVCAAADPLAAAQHRQDLRDLLAPALSGGPRPGCRPDRHRDRGGRPVARPPPRRPGRLALRRGKGLPDHPGRRPGRGRAPRPGP